MTTQNKTKKVATATTNAFNGLNNDQVARLRQQVSSPTGNRLAETSAQKNAVSSLDTNQLAKLKDSYLHPTQYMQGNSMQGYTTDQLNKIGQDMRHPTVQNASTSYASNYDAVANGGKANVPTYNYSMPKIETSNYSAQYINQPYTPSATVLAAQQKLDAMRGNKPGEYQSQYADQLNSLLQQVINPEKFNYDYTKDPVFQQYAKEYRQNAQLGMENAMGEAAALSGGYGNSYAQTVGQQQYNATMQELNNIIPELEQNEYAKYLNQLQNVQNQYNTVAQAEANDYSRYYDALNQYYNDLDRASNEYQQAYATDYNKWANDRDFAVAMDKYNYDKAMNQIQLEQGLADAAFKNQMTAQQYLDELYSQVESNKITSAKNQNDYLVDMAKQQNEATKLQNESNKTDDAYMQNLYKMYNDAVQNASKYPDSYEAQNSVAYYASLIDQANGIDTNVNSAKYDKNAAVKRLMSMNNADQATRFLLSLNLNDKDLADLLGTVYNVDATDSNAIDRIKNKLGL